MIVATDIVYYEPEKQMPDKAQWRPRLFSPTAIPFESINSATVPEALETYLRELLPKDEAVPVPRTHEGLFISGERVLADEDAVLQLQLKVYREYKKDVSAIDMESAGIALACKASGTKYGIIKAVSDYGTVSKDDRWQKAAAAVSIYVIIEWIEQLNREAIHRLSDKDMGDTPVDLFDKVMRVAEVAGGLLPTKGIEPEEVTARSIDDLVTYLDVAVERFIIKELNDESIGVCAEELHNIDTSSLHSGRWWVIDPVDGTQNLVAGRPEVAISIAYFIEGKPELGVISMPYRGVTVGVWDGKPIEVNGYPWVRRRALATNLKDAAIALPGDIRRLRETGIEAVLEGIIKKAAGVRITGALAYDLASLALGEIDGRISTNAKIFDIAAGVLLVRNVGGIVTDLDGQPWGPESSTILAAGSRELHDEIVTVVKTALKGKAGSWVSLLKGL